MGAPGKLWMKPPPERPNKINQGLNQPDSGADAGNLTSRSGWRILAAMHSAFPFRRGLHRSGNLIAGF